MTVGVVIALACPVRGRRIISTERHSISIG